MLSNASALRVPGVSLAAAAAAASAPIGSMRGMGACWLPVQAQKALVPPGSFGQGDNEISREALSSHKHKKDRKQTNILEVGQVPALHGMEERSEGTAA